MVMNYYGLVNWVKNIIFIHGVQNFLGFFVIKANLEMKQILEWIDYNAILIILLINIMQGMK